MNIKLGDKLIVLNAYDRFITNSGLIKIWKIGDLLTVKRIAHTNIDLIDQNGNYGSTSSLNKYIKANAMKLIGRDK